MARLYEAVGLLLVMGLLEFILAPQRGSLTHCNASPRTRAPYETLGSQGGG